MIEFACETCGKDFKVPDNLAGKSGTCKACGSAIRIPTMPGPIPPSPALQAIAAGRPIPTAPHPEVPLPGPAPAPAAPPTVNVGVAFPQPAPGKGTSGLGVAATILGLLALLVCWIPLLGLLAVPLILIGGVLALVGVIVALSGKKVGVGWPVSGVVTNAAALVGVVVMSIAVAGTTAATADAMGKAVAEAKKKEAEARARRVAEVPIPEDVGKEAGVKITKASDVISGLRMYKDKELTRADLGNSVGSDTRAKVLAVEGEAAQVEVIGGVHAGKTTWLKRQILCIERP